MDDDIKKLGNQQISLRYEKIESSIHIVKEEIAEQVKDSFNMNIEGNDFEDNDKFLQKIKNIAAKEGRREFELLLGSKDRLDIEIEQRKKILLRTIGVTIPNQLQALLFEECTWRDFGKLDDIVSIVRSVQKNEKRIPKKIILSPKLSKTLLRLWFEDIVELFILREEGPQANVVSLS